MRKFLASLLRRKKTDPNIWAPEVKEKDLNKKPGGAGGPAAIHPSQL